MQWMNARGDLAVIVLAMAVLGGCDNLSNVGDESSGQPSATATVVNYGAGDSATGDVTVDVRAQAEVLLTGKDSIESDKPILSYLWELQNANVCPALMTVRNLTTVNVTLPAATAPMDCVFKLTVQDANGVSDTATATLRVQPVLDSNRFLTFADGVPRIRVVAATTDPAVASGGDFTLRAKYRVTYRSRAGLSNTETFDLGPQVTSAWSPAVGSGGDSASDFRNPVVDFPLPSLNFDDITRRYQSEGRVPADKLPDPAYVDDAEVEVIVTLDAPTLQDKGKLFVLDAAGAVVQTQTNAGTGLPSELVLDDDTVDALRVRGGGLENRQTARSYYEAIDTGGVGGLKKTLREWLTQNCFDPDAANYGADANAVYTNNYDLGFGRDMYFRTAKPATCTSSTFGQSDAAAVVLNYPTLEAAGKKIGPIIAVAMEYKAFDLTRSQPGNVTFYAFTPDEATGEFRRVLSANFDGRGEKYLPGSCTVCHGGKPLQAAPLGGSEPAGSATYAASDGNIGSTFMPWDLESFLYWDTDPAIRRDAEYLSESRNADLAARFTRAAQEPELRKLNIAAMSTYGPGNPIDPLFAPYDEKYAGPVELVNLWYGGAGLPDPTFHNRVVAAGWKSTVAGNLPDSETIYLDVFARDCRACHTQRVSGGPQFLTWNELKDLSPRVREQVFDSGSMPAARLSDDRLWVPVNGVAPGDLLAAHVGAIDGTSAPNAPGVDAVAKLDVWVLNPGDLAYQRLAEVATVRRNAQIRLDGQQSLYPGYFSYALDQKPSSSQASLVQPNQPKAAFKADLPGTYSARLTIADSGARRESVSTFEVPNQRPTLVITQPYDVEQRGSLVVTNPATGVLAGATDGDGDVLTASLNETFCPTLHADPLTPPTVAANGTFVFVHNGDPLGQSGQFGVRVTDPFGLTADACVEISVGAAPDSVAPSPPTNLSATALDGTLGVNATFPVRLAWNASTDVDNNGNNTTASLRYQIFRRVSGSGAFPLLPVVVVPETSFDDESGAANTTYDYLVKAADVRGNRADSNSPLVTTRSSYRTNVNPIWSSRTTPDLDTCISCHVGTSPSGDLNLAGTVEQNFIAVDSRINRSAGNEESGLIPCKPREFCAHGGGQRWLENSDPDQQVLKWIREGARNN